jgi:hypothetical protein
MILNRPSGRFFNDPEVAPAISPEYYMGKKTVKGKLK